MCSRTDKQTHISGSFLTFWPCMTMVTAMDYVSTDCGVDSSSRFRFAALTNSLMQTKALPTPNYRKCGWKETRARKETWVEDGDILGDVSSTWRVILLIGVGMWQVSSCGSWSTSRARRPNQLLLSTTTTTNITTSCYRRHIAADPMWLMSSIATTGKQCCHLANNINYIAYTNWWQARIWKSKSHQKSYFLQRDLGPPSNVQFLGLSESTPKTALRLVQLLLGLMAVFCEQTDILWHTGTNCIRTHAMHVMWPNNTHYNHCYWIFILASN